MKKKYMYVDLVHVVGVLPSSSLFEVERAWGRLREEVEEEDEQAKIAAVTRSTVGPLGSIESPV